MHSDSASFDTVLFASAIEYSNMAGVINILYLPVKAIHRGLNRNEPVLFDLHKLTLIANNNPSTVSEIRQMCGVIFLITDP